SVEKTRNTLVPADFMKQGYADTYRDLTNLAISVLFDDRQEREALATAEQARGRAFLDLLATKNLAPKTEQPADHGAIMVRLDTPSSLRSPQEQVLPPLLTRGDSPGNLLAGDARRPQSLASSRSVPAASVDDLLVLAARLHSTILAYWVDKN